MNGEKISFTNLLRWNFSFKMNEESMISTFHFGGLIGELELRYSLQVRCKSQSLIFYQLRTIRKKRIICMRIFLLSSFFLCVMSKMVKKYEFTICGKVTRYREYLIFHQFGWKSPKKTAIKNFLSLKNSDPQKQDFLLLVSQINQLSYNFILTTFYRVGRSVKITHSQDSLIYLQLELVEMCVCHEPK